METGALIIDHLISPRPYLTVADIVVIRGWLFSIIPNILGAIAILFIAFLIYKVTARPLRKLLVKSQVEEWLARIIAYNIYRLVVVVIAAVAALSQLGLHLGPALTGLGIFGLALGFIAQDSLANIVAGFLIFADKPFRVGDYVTVGTNYGRIELITMRSTRIRTQDNTYVVIPNQKIINEIFVDHSTNGDTRILTPVTISYESSIEVARAAILKEVAGIEDVLVNPAPDVVVDKLGDSGMQLLVRVWIANAAKERQVHFRTAEAVKHALTEARIEISYPHVKLVGK